MRILGRVTSINARKVLWLADTLGLAYEHEVWGQPNRDPKVPEFLSLNPNGLVPVLVDGDYVLWESHAIMTYLVAEYGQGRFATDDTKLAGLIGQWMNWQSSTLMPTALYATLGLVRKVPGFDDRDKIAESLKVWINNMQILEAQFERTGGKLAGDEFTLADISIALNVHRWEMIDQQRMAELNIEIDLPVFAYCSTYLKRIKAEQPKGLAYLGPETP